MRTLTQAELLTIHGGMSAETSTTAGSVTSLGDTPGNPSTNRSNALLALFITAVAGLGIYHFFFHKTEVHSDPIPEPQATRKVKTK